MFAAPLLNLCALQTLWFSTLSHPKRPSFCSSGTLHGQVPSAPRAGRPGAPPRRPAQPVSWGRCGAREGRRRRGGSPWGGRGKRWVRVISCVDDGDPCARRCSLTRRPRPQSSSECQRGSVRRLRASHARSHATLDVAGASRPLHATADLEHARQRGLAAVAVWTRRLAAPPHRMSHRDLGRAWEAASLPGSTPWSTS